MTGRPVLKPDEGKCSFPLWTASSGTGSEPQRTKYSWEPELYQFLARTKACLEFPLTPISMSNSAYYVICTHRKYLANAYVLITNSAL